MIYLNNAATTYPKPQRVLDAVQKEINALPFHAARAGLHAESVDVLTQCRKNLAILFTIQNHENIIFTSGATESLNLVFKGLALQGKHVITTQVEHNSVIRPLMLLEKMGKIQLSFAPCNQHGVVAPENIIKHIQNNTALIALNHCSNVTGTSNELATVAEVCREKGILFLVDASQSAGVLPLNMAHLPLDILVFTGHKSLMGIRGIGGLYIREGLELAPLKTGGTGVKSDLLFQPEERPLYYEAGTQNMAGVVSLMEGTQFILDTGREALYRHETATMQYLLEALTKIKGVTLYGDYAMEQRCPIVSFTLAGVSSEDVGFILENSFDIIIRSGLHCAPLVHKSLGTYPHGSLRASISYFTTHEEIDIFIDAVQQIAGMQ